MENGSSVSQNRSKVVVAGRSGSGKTSTVKNLVGRHFESSCLPTQVAEVTTVEVATGTEEMKIVKETFGEEFGLLVRHLGEDWEYVEDETTIRKERISGLSNGEFHVNAETVKEVISRVDSVKKVHPASESYICSIWDLGGSHIFDVLHSLFIKDFGVMLLVFNLFNLTDEAPLQEKEEEAKELLYWLQYASTNLIRTPIILIGTHLDKVNVAKTKAFKDTNEFIGKMMKEAGLRTLVPNGDLLFFPKNNSFQKLHKVEDSVEDIKRCLLEVISHKKAMISDGSNISPKVKLSWSLLLSIIFDEKVPNLSLNRCIEIGKKFNASKYFVLEALKHYSFLGCIMFFPEVPYDVSQVILDPNWLFDGLGRIFYDSENNNGSKSLVAKDEIDVYEQTGVLPRAVLFEVFWPEFSEAEKQFLEYICLQKSIFSVQQYGDFSQVLVPSMNRTATDLPVLEDSISMSLNFSSVLPNETFPRVVSYLSDKMSNLEQVSEPEIRIDSAKFSVVYEGKEVYLQVRNARLEKRIVLSVPREQRNFASNILAIADGELVKRVLTNDDQESPPCEIMLESGSDKKVFASYSDIQKSLESKQENVKTMTRVEPNRNENFFKRLLSLLLEWLKLNLAGYFVESRAVKINQFKDFLPEKDVMMDKSAWVFDCFLAHEWATSHKKVVEISKKLKDRGLEVWLDEEQIRTSPDYAIEEGLSKSKVVLVFITKMYFERVQNKNSNACKELTSAVKRPVGVDYVIPVVLEKEFTDEMSWPHGIVRFHVNHLYRFHLTNEEEVKQNLPKLADHIKSL